MVGLPVRTASPREKSSATAFALQAHLLQLQLHQRAGAAGDGGVDDDVVRFALPDTRHQLVVAQRVIDEAEAEHDVDLDVSLAITSNTSPV